MIGVALHPLSVCRTGSQRIAGSAAFPLELTIRWEQDVMV
jgi:hypothetical protein